MQNFAFTKMHPKTYAKWWPFCPGGDELNDEARCIIVVCANKHDDVMKWTYFPRNRPFVRDIQRPQVNSPQKGQWRRALMFSLICARINDWVNNGEAGDLRRHRDHYDVIVMKYIITFWSVIGNMVVGYGYQAVAIYIRGHVYCWYDNIMILPSIKIETGNV